MSTIVLHNRRAENTNRKNATTRTVALKEAFDMFDSFSEGNVFYGRTAVLMGAIVALAVLVHFI